MFKAMCQRARALKHYYMVKLNFKKDAQLEQRQIKVLGGHYRLLLCCSSNALFLPLRSPMRCCQRLTSLNEKVRYPLIPALESNANSVHEIITVDTDGFLPSIHGAFVIVKEKR